MSSSLTEWLMANYGREEMKKETGLSRIKEVLGLLIPQLSKKKIITIAGTNGKGETTLRLSQELGKRTHCAWISPHIERITERFRDENGEISENELQKLVNGCHELVIKNSFRLSYYEFLFFVFCTWAARKDPEFLLLEVGLGGRLDAVNIFDADMVLLPSISRDHQEFLGNRYDLILGEKLALLRQNSVLVSFLSLKYLCERAETISHSVGAKFIDLEAMKLAGSWDFSRRNHLLARAACLLLTKTPENGLREALSHTTFDDTQLANRGERVLERGEWIFYGSHNVDGVRNLIQFLKCGNYNFSRPPYDVVLVAFSQRDPRDLRVMLRMLKKSGLGNLMVTTFPHAKAAPAAMMEELASLEGIKFVHDAQVLIQNSQPGHRCLVTGSYYFLGHFKQRLFC
jgi:dihydrofolate synthase/folylpolyglutamate synthase